MTFFYLCYIFFVFFSVVVCVYIFVGCLFLVMCLCVYVYREMPSVWGWFWGCCSSCLRFVINMPLRVQSANIRKSLYRYICPRLCRCWDISFNYVLYRTFEDCMNLIIYIICMCILCNAVLTPLAI